MNVVTRNQILSICMIACLVLIHLPAFGANSGNLISNPGGETGIVSPWVLSPADALSSVPNDTPPTQQFSGNYWFGAEVILSTSTPSKGAQTGVVLRQELDISNFENIQNLTIGADYAAIGETLTGTFNSLLMEPLFAIGFLDLQGDIIQAVFIEPPELDILDTSAELINFRETLNAIPAGASSLDLLITNSIKRSTSGPASTAVNIGIDNAFLSVTYFVPEPSTLLLSLLSSIGLLHYRNN